MSSSGRLTTVTSADIVNGTIQTADIAADQITNRHVQGGVTTTYGTTASAAPGLLIPEMAFNITTDGTVPYLIGFSGSFSGTVGGDTAVFDLYINGTGALPGTGTQFRRQYRVGATGYGFLVAATYLYTPPAAGTYDVGWYFWRAGTGSLDVVQDQRLIWAVKLLR